MSYALPAAPVFQVGTSGGGGGGVGSDSNFFFLPFSYGDATPEPIDIVPAGKRVLSVRLFIFTAFNGSGAALSVGSSPEELMSEDENDPSALGEYSVYPGIGAYGSSTIINLYITPGAGASAGSGLVIIEYQP